MAAVRIFVADVDRSIAFYSLLGFTLEEKWGPAFAIVSEGDLELWLSGPGASAGKPMPDGRQPEPGGWNRIVVVTEDIQKLAKFLRDTGSQFRNDIITGPGGSQVVLDDPDGNPIELFQPRS